METKKDEYGREIRATDFYAVAHGICLLKDNGYFTANLENAMFFSNVDNAVDKANELNALYREQNKESLAGKVRAVRITI